MPQLITYNNCPACNSQDFNFHIKAKDYTVSNKEFEIVKCNNCSLVFTQNIPTQEEIGVYYKSENYISHSDTKEGLISKIYHKVRNITLTSKRKTVINFTKKQKGNLLDIGAGTGAFANEMQSNGWKIIGLEPDDVARNVAQKNYNLTLQNPSELFNQSAESFDAITMWHVLEHVHSLKEYLQQFHKILNKSGRVFIAVPNYTSYDAQHYQQFWAAYDVPRHLYHFSPQSMKILAQSMGFNVIATKPMWFDSTYVSMLSEQYKNGKPNNIKALMVGLWSNVKAIFNNEKCSSIIYIFEKK